MAFGDFRYPDVLRQLGLTYASARDLFGAVPPVAAGAGLIADLPVFSRLALASGTEKARSEWLIAPVLGDAWARYDGQISLYSGTGFSAEPESGLTGYVDFLIGRSPQNVSVTPPVVILVEAKNENIAGGLGQCIAAMVGAQRWNLREGTPCDPVYGCSTSGSIWKFLQLSGTTMTLDLNEYTITQLDRILGILIHMIGAPPVR